MKTNKYMYTILKNSDGKYWLWFDEGGSVVENVYRPNMHPYHEIITNSELRDGAEIWIDELEAVPESCELRPRGDYTDAYLVCARLKDESKYLATAPEIVDPHMPKPIEKKPGRGVTGNYA